MASHIPFVKNKKDSEFFRRFFADSDIVRLPLRSIEKIDLGKYEGEIWIDTEFEGFLFKESQRDEKWTAYMEQFADFMILAKRKNLETPTGIDVTRFVDALLDETMTKSPSLITVPQIPFNKDFNVGKINRKLADAAGKWREKTGRKINFITPVVITNQTQSNLKTARNSIVKTTQSVFEKSDSIGVWVVDSSLNDQAGTSTFRDIRFKGLIELYDEINAKINSKLSVAGPYWGLNLVHWARGQITHPAISLGNSFCYYVSGSKGGGPSNVRVAIPPLLRWANANLELKEWLKHAKQNSDATSKEHVDFSELLKKFDILSTDREGARVQIAKFYKEWLNRIDKISPGGRSLALYQEFSTAYIIGKSLPPLSKAEKSAKNPAKIAEQFMTNCL